MTRKIADEFVIPKCTGKAFIVKKGQVLRVIAHEGKQVADIIFLNAHNYKEQFAARHSVAVNVAEGLGNAGRITKLYSKPPWENVMLTVIDDKVSVHHLAGHCTRKLWEVECNQPYHRSCSDNFEECLEVFGIRLEDLDSCGVFNVFMRPPSYEHHKLQFMPPVAEKGDYIDFLAEMDVLVAASMCPHEDEVNDFEPKAMKFQILE
ncbi:unnamed protein product [marine sediment metagenome]|uniref:DUF1989 domain-containing protein n=1 Tax=marine sediment metagenome TaxID=412755 RepID=X1NC05_9ZZZZ